MFVDPKISLTQRVTDPAGTIRKARVLLDQHLRQDAAYSRQVSRTEYRIGADIRCVITHEFGQTYIALDQKALPIAGTEETSASYQFLNILLGDYGIGFNYLTAWASRNGSAWTQIQVPSPVATCLQYGSGVIIQLSKTEFFLVGLFDLTNPLGGAGWGLVNPQNLSMGSSQAFPAINGKQVIQSASGAFVGGSVVCLTLRTSAGSFLAWFDYAQNRYRYVLPYTTLSLPNVGNFFPFVEPVELTRAAGKSYSEVAFGVALSGQVGLWTADVNTATFQFLGGLPTNYTGAYVPMLQAGANGQLGAAVPSASSTQPTIQTGTDFYILTPIVGGAYSTISYPKTAIGFGYTPVGWTADFSDIPGDLYFFSTSAQLGMVPRSRVSSAFINYLVAVNGIYDVMGGGFYSSPTQKSAVSLGLPPYSDPNSLAYALDTPGLLSKAYYLGPRIAPWLNLY